MLLLTHTDEHDTPIVFVTLYPDDCCLRYASRFASFSKNTSFPSIVSFTANLSSIYVPETGSLTSRFESLFLVVSDELRREPAPLSALAIARVISLTSQRSNAKAAVTRIRINMLRTIETQNLKKGASAHAAAPCANPKFVQRN